MMIGGPRFELARIRELAEDPKCVKVSGAALQHFASTAEMLAFAINTLRSLQDENYAHSLQLKSDVADVFGIRIEDEGWYLKLTVFEDEPRVLVISLHPLEYELKTRGGKIQP